MVTLKTGHRGVSFYYFGGGSFLWFIFLSVNNLSFEKFTMGRGKLVFLSNPSNPSYRMNRTIEMPLTHFPINLTLCFMINGIFTGQTFDEIETVTFDSKIGILPSKWETFKRRNGTSASGCWIWRKRCLGGRRMKKKMYEPCHVKCAIWSEQLDTINTHSQLFVWKVKHPIEWWIRSEILHKSFHPLDDERENFYVNWKIIMKQ